MVTQVTTANFSNATLTALTSPTITSITVTNSSYVPTGETAVSLSGGYVTVVGSSFVSGATVYIDSTPATSVTFVNSTQLNVQVPGLVSNSYIVYVINLDGSVAIQVNGINYSANPTWVTSGTQGFSSGTISLQLVASSDSTITYALASGSSLPSGLTLTSSGLLSGTVTGTGIVTYNFSVVATDVETQQSTQAFSITITFSDQYWNSVTLLLNGETPVTPFITDASTNNFNLTINGDTRPLPINPYQNGYYSNYFDGTGDYLSVANFPVGQSIGTGDFTMETWVYPTATLSGSQSIIRLPSTQTMLTLNGVFRGYLMINGSTSSQSSYTVIPNVWQHLAITRSSGTLYMFANGVQVYSAASTAIIDYSGTSPLIIGSLNGVSEYWPGYISNVRVIKGTAVYTTAFTPSTIPLTAIANTSLLTSQSNRLIDNSTNNFTITKNGDVTVTQSNPFGIPTSATVNNLYSTYFDGTGDYVSVASNAAFALPGDFTYECWFNSGNTGTTSQFMEVPVTGGFSIYYSGTQIFVSAYGDIALITYTYTMPLGVWTHIAVVRSGSGSNNLQLYINGTSVASATTNYSFVQGALRVGGASYYFTGPISNVRLVKGVAVYTGTFTPPTSNLTATQSSGTNISAITGSQTSLLTCQNSTLIDNSTYVSAITSFGQAQPIAISPFTQTTTSVALTTLGSTYFDGNGDYLSVVTGSSGALGNNCTVEFWVYPTSAPANSRILNNATNSGVDVNYVAGQIQFCNAPYTTTTLTLNAWTHVVCTLTSGTAKIYFNGVSQTLSGITTGYNLTSTANIWIGGISGFAQWFPGYLSNVRLIKDTVLYTSNFAPPVQPLTAVTNTSLLTLQYNGGANNSGIRDNSSFNNIITRVGNTSQGTFSPYGSNWSNYFPATGSYLYATNTNFNISSVSVVWTYESWLLPLTAGHYFAIGSGGPYGNSFTVGWSVGTANKFRVNGANGGGLTVNFESTGTYAAGTWYHVAVTRTTSGVYTLYINGLADGTQTYNAGGQAGGTTIVINGVYDNNGLGNSGGQFYDQDVRFIVGTALGTGSTYPVPTAPLTAINGTVFLSCQSAGFIDNGPLAVAISVGGTPVAQRFSKFAQVIQTPISYGGYFNGVGDGLITPATTGNLVNTDFTWEAWVNFISLSASSCIIASGSTTDRTLLYYDITNGLRYAVARSATDQISIQQGSTSGWSTGTWYHVAIVRSGNNYTLYRNGVSIGTGTSAYSQSELTKGLTVGYSELSSSYLNITGYISNARVVNGVAVYTSTFTPSTTPLTATQSVNVNGSPSSAITGTSTRLLTCQSTKFIDNSTNAFTITAYGTSSPRTFNPFGVTNNTNQAYTPALYGGSAYFDGTGDYLQLANNPTYCNLNGVNFTIECWAYATTVASNICLLACAANPSTVGVQFFILSGNLTIYVNNGNTIVGSIAFPVNSWNHVAFVRNGTTCTLYLNGVFVASATVNVTNPASTQPFVIGGITTSTGWNSNLYLTGYMADVRVVNGTALYTSNFVPPSTPLTTYSNTTPSSLLTNFTSGGVIDYHMNNVLETVGNAQLNTNVKQFGNASISFDGTGDSLNLGITTLNPFLSNNFTIEFWLYIPALPGTRTQLLYLNANASGYAAIALQITSSNKLGLSISETGSTWKYDDTTGVGSALTAATWQFVTIVRNGQNIQIYLGGVAQGAAYALTASTTSLMSTYTLNQIAVYNTSFYYLNGYIDDLRITNGIARYTSNFSVPTSPFQTI